MREATTPQASVRSPSHGAASRLAAAVLALPTPHPPIDRRGGAGEAAGPPPLFPYPKKAF
jgi:hypothetical protein